MLNSSTLAVPHQHPGSGKIARQLQRKTSAPLETIQNKSSANIESPSANQT